MLKSVVVISALVNTLAGSALAALGVREGFPSIAIATGVAVFLQGAYTLLYIAVLQGGGEFWRTALLGGHGLAAFAGGLAVLSGVIYNLHPKNGDYELAPMSMGIIMFGLAALSILYAVRTSRQSRVNGVT